MLLRLALGVAALLAAVVVPPVSAHVSSSPAPAAVPPPPPGRSPEEVLGEVRRATERYLDIERARADGYVQMSGMVVRHGYHFVNLPEQLRASAGALAGAALALARPPILLYVERAGGWQLVGVEYALPRPPDANPFPGASWQRHEASCHYRDFLELPAESASACPPAHPESGAPFVAWHPEIAVAHVWAWYPNPDGPFAPENPYLAPWGGTAAPHGHGRNPAEILYSEFTHRAAGLALLALAALIAWEARRRRPFPLNALSAAVWVLFGLWLFVTSDAESWPLGPRSIADIFTDPLVLQHKALALVPLVIGAVGLLQAAGHLARPGWAYVAPALALVAWASLFVHSHDGRFHLDAIYLQHAAMGLTAVGLGAALLAAHGRAPESRAGAWLWPAFLAVLAVVLLFYREA